MGAVSLKLIFVVVTLEYKNRFIARRFKVSD